MMTVNHLFFKRLWLEWKYHFRIFRMVFDWTVVLYIITPALAVAIYGYIQWWHELPIWSRYVSSWMMFIVLYLVISMGAIRLFIEEGDQAFLLQRSAWMNGLKCRGMAYSFISNGISLLTIYLILLPFTIHMLNGNVSLLCGLFIFHYLSMHVLALLQQLIELKYQRWTRYMMKYVLYTLAGVMVISVSYVGLQQPFLLMLADVLIITALVPLVRARITHKSSFMEDVRREQKHKQKYAALALAQSGEVEKKNVLFMDKPLMFRSTTKLFELRTPVHLLAETLIKIFCRRWSLVSFYFKFIGVSGLAIMFVSIWWIKAAVWIILWFLLMSWLRQFCTDFEKSSYQKMYTWSNNVITSAHSKAMNWLMIPWIVITLFIFVFSFFLPF